VSLSRSDTFHRIQRLVEQIFLLFQNTKYKADQGKFPVYPTGPYRLPFCSSVRQFVSYMYLWIWGLCNYVSSKNTAWRVLNITFYKFDLLDVFHPNFLKTGILVLKTLKNYVSGPFASQNCLEIDSIPGFKYSHLNISWHKHFWEDGVFVAFVCLVVHRVVGPPNYPKILR
jgi:hypothetical protein